MNIKNKLSEELIEEIDKSNRETIMKQYMIVGDLSDNGVPIYVVKRKKKVRAEFRYWGPAVKYIEQITTRFLYIQQNY